MTRRSKITNQQIIQDFNLIHGNKYDYSKVKYTPLNKFVGNTECFSELFINDKIH